MTGRAGITAPAPGAEKTVRINSEIRRERKTITTFEILFAALAVLAAGGIGLLFGWMEKTIHEKRLERMMEQYLYDSDE